MTYYVIRTDKGFYELRQTRFIGKRNHPRDVCAVVRSVEEMRGVVDRHFADVDWSHIQPA